MKSKSEQMKMEKMMGMRHPKHESDMAGGTRKASPAAKRRNPNLRKVRGA